MSNIFLDTVKKDNISSKDDDYISLNDTTDLTRLAYSNKSSDIPLNNNSITDRFETETFINHKESFENNNSRINNLNEEIRELKFKCREIYEKDEKIQILKKECETLNDTLNDYKKYKEENIFLKKEQTNFKNEIKTLKIKIIDLENNLLKSENKKIVNKEEEGDEDEDEKEDKIDIDIDKIKNILSNRLKDTHEKHIDDLIKEYKLDDYRVISKSVMEELLYKAIHL